METETLFSAAVALGLIVSSIVEASVLEAALVLTEKSLLSLLLKTPGMGMGHTKICPLSTAEMDPSTFDEGVGSYHQATRMVASNLNETNERFRLSDQNKVKEPDAENKDAAETKDDEDDDDDDDDDDDSDDDDSDDDDDDDDSDDESDDEGDIRGGGANGGGGSDDDDDDDDEDDDDEDSDDEDEDDEEDDEDEEQPSSKKTK